MKVAHLSTGISNSSAVTRLHKSMLNKGIDSYLITLRETNNIDRAIKYTSYTKFMKLKRSLNIILDKLILKIYKDKENLLYSLTSGYDISKIKELKDADIIHLHWISGSFIDLKSLKKLNKPIVYTCHDSLPFTGGCHVKYKCENYKTGCGNCRMLNSNKLKDISYYINKRKEDIYRDLDLAFICPSNWINKQLKESNVCNSKKSYVIGNTLDFDIFNIKSNNSFKELESNKIKVLFGAVDPKGVEYKGYSIIIEFIKKLKRDNKELLDKMQFVVFGTSDIEEIKNLGVNCTAIGEIKSQEKLANLYNDCDILLYPSLEDNLPNVVMESLACGLPVVAFNIGGISDLVKHKKNGYLAKEKDVKELLQGVNWIIDNKIDKEKIRESVFCDYNNDVIVEKHINLYKGLIIK